MRTLFITILIILTTTILCPFTAFAEALATSNIDKTQISLNDYVILTIKITDAQSIEPPILMGMDNFKQMSMSSSNNTSIINGQISNSMLFQYVLVPKATGTLNIGEAYVNTNNKRLHVKPLLITVTDSTNTQTYNNYGTNNNTTNQYIDTSKNIALRADVNNHDPYKNEQITYTISLYFRGSLSDIQLETPQFQDFIAEPLDDRRQYSTNVNGMVYNVLEKAYALFPTKSGNLTIPPTSITCSLLSTMDPFDQLFGNYNVQPIALETKPVTIKVKEPPLAPKYYKNSVGQFKINTEISNTKLNIGETARLQINIWGKGNITNIQKPDFKFDENFKNNFKIYDITPVTQITDKSEVISGQKIFKYDLVPLKSGTYHIPSAEYAYFNPETKMYHQLKSSAIEITVKPGQSINITDVNNQVKSDKETDEMIGIHTNDETINDESIETKQYLIYLILFIIPEIILGIILFIIKLKEKQNANIHITKSKQAYKIANKELKKLKTLVKNNKSKEFFSKLDNILKDYIGFKLYLPGGSLTSKDVEIHLKSKNISNKTILFITEILKLCEMSEYYHGEKAHNKLSIAFKDADRVLKLLEKELKK
ncbi:MAG: BatD family protein [Vampirovibrionia bacterium]